MRPEPEQRLRRSRQWCSKATRATRLLPIAAAGWLAAWMVFDTDKVDDVNRWTTTLLEMIEDPAEHFFDGSRPPRAATPQCGSRRRNQRSDYAGM